jgi:hypothetical protein
VLHRLNSAVTLIQRTTTEAPQGHTNVNQRIRKYNSGLQNI